MAVPARATCSVTAESIAQPLLLRNPTNERELFLIHKANHDLRYPKNAEQDNPIREPQLSPAEQTRSTFSENFALGAMLGKGAYAPVHFAVHRKSGKAVAVKIYENFKFLERDRRALITREVHIMRKLRHQNIVKYGGIFNEAKALYIVMQYLGGGSLHSIVKKNPKARLSEEETKPLFYEVLKGFQYLHSHNVVHRDLKLENVLLDDRGSVRIIDFGFASLVKAGALCRMSCGTPSYMPPEILKKDEYVGTCADMWSMGICLYAMLHGSYPFRSQDPKELYSKIMTGEYPINSTLSSNAKHLVHSLLALKPEERLSADEALLHPWLIQ